MVGRNVSPGVPKARIGCRRETRRMGAAGRDRSRPHFGVWSNLQRGRKDPNDRLAGHSAGAVERRGAAGGRLDTKTPSLRFHCLRLCPFRCLLPAARGRLAAGVAPERQGLDRPVWNTPRPERRIRQRGYSCAQGRSPARHRRRYDCGGTPRGRCRDPMTHLGTPIRDVTGLPEISSH